MNITRETIKETIKTVMAEEADYKAFFKKALEKAGKSIPSMSDEEKKEFFNKIDAAWNAKGEKNEALKGDQHELDVDGDGDIEADDLADLRAGKKINKESIVTEADNFAGWIAIDHRGKKIEIKKGEAKDLYNAKLLAIKKLKVPKSKVGMLAIKPAVNESAGCNCGCGGCSTPVTEGRAFINAAKKAKEEGKTEFEFNGKTYPVTLKESIVNEARLGKVSLLRSVESGDSSHVEGVKISPSLAFELRMFLERPMLAKTRTGIAINNAQMKDAIGMLAKVGVHKRLSSGVKNEFADLLKKYNK